MKNDSEKNIKYYAAGWTLLLHAAVLLIMIFLVIKTPIPPYPVAGGGGGLEVNLGNSDDGMGEVQPEKLMAENNVNANVQPNNTAEDNNVITQNIEDAPSLKANKNKHKSKNNKITVQPKDDNSPKINDPVVNTMALYNKKKNGGGEGETGKPGDQGKPNGDPNSKNHYGDGGSGGGTGGGTGPGTGPGDGPGVGSGKDKGVTFYLKGRNKKSLPIPLYVIKEEGIVVVEIIVNREGKVVRTKAGAKGTNTTNSTLWKRAEEAAKKAEFDSDPKAAEEQKGNITYHFILN